MGLGAHLDVAVEGGVVQRRAPAAVRHIDTAQQGDQDLRTFHCLVGSCHMQRRLPVLVPGVDIGRVLDEHLHGFLQWQHSHSVTQQLQELHSPAPDSSVVLTVPVTARGQEEAQRTSIQTTSQASGMVLSIQMPQHTSPLLCLRAVASPSKLARWI